MSSIQRAITQAVAQESPTKSVHPEFLFGTIFYMFVSNVLVRHDLGVWSHAVLDGMDDWSSLVQSEDAVDFSGLFSTLGGELGWRIPLRFCARLRGDSVDYDFSVGTESARWKELTQGQVSKVGVGLSSRDPNFAWNWAITKSGSIALEDWASGEPLS